MIEVTALLDTFVNYLRRGRTIAFGLAAVSTVVLGGCDDVQMTPRQHVQRAQELRLEGKVQGAVLELKNALQQQPDNAAARFMLGELYLEIGNGTAAEKELNRALESGMDARSVLLPRARAWLLQQDYQKILDELQEPAPDSPLSRAPVLALRGEAHLGLRQFDAAEAAFKKAREAAPGSLDAVVGLAQVAMARDDLEAAEAYLQQAQEIGKNNSDVIRLKGDIAFRHQDFSAAEAAYRTLVERVPQNLVYRLSLAWAQIGNEKFQAAIKNLDMILRTVPEHPQTNYLRAVAAYRQENYQESQNFADRVLANDSRHAPALLLAGAASYALGDMEQANNSLSRFVDMAPQYGPGRKLLAATQMRLGENRAAMRTLKPLATSPETIEDDQVLRLVATAALQSGDMQAGRNYIEKAVEKSPDDARLRAQLGMTRINLGEIEEGLSDLETAVEKDPEFKRAEVVLGFNFLRRGNYEKALETAKNLQESLSDNSIGYVLEGMTRDQMGNQEKAAEAFKMALKVKPSATDAAHNLASIQVRNNRLEEGRRIYLDFLERNPDDRFILVQLAKLEARLNQPEKVEEYLKRIVKLSPDALPPRVFLARFYLVRNRPEEAIQILQEVLQDHPDNSGLLEVLGRALLESGQAREAVNTFKRLSELESSSAAPHYWLANARLRAGNPGGAQAAIDQALSISPESVQAQLLKGDIAARMNDAAALTAVLDELKTDEKITKTPQYRDLAATLALLEGRVEDAVAEFKAANASQPSTERTARLAMIEARSGDMAGAVDRLTKWLEDHPKDGGIRLQLGGLYASRERYGDAVAVLETMVEQQPNSWAAHNDLAWMLYKQGKLDRAGQHAAKANELAPDQPLVLDTYGTVLLASGRPEKSIVPLERAADAMPESHETRITLARAYEAAGRREDAVKMLERLLDSGDEFSERGEAQSLLDELKAK